MNISPYIAMSCKNIIVLMTCVRKSSYNELEMRSHGNLLVFLFVWGLSPNSGIFYWYGDVSITGEGLQIFTYARHSWPLSSEGCLACHTYSVTLIMVISEDPWHSHPLSKTKQWSYYQFLRFGSFAAGIRTPNLPLAGPTP